MSTRSVRRPRRLLAGLVGLVASTLALSSCSVYDIPLPGGPDVGSNPITVHVMFRDVLDLVPQSTVKVDDVTVGKVTSIKLKGYTADVTVKLPKTIDLPDNARAEIRQTSLLGEKFVSLSKPSDPTGKLGNGDVIGLENTGRNPEIEEVFNALALLLNGGGVGQLKTIVSELNNTFEGREDEVKSVLTQIRTFMGQLDENKASIVAAIENTNRLAGEIQKQDGAIKGALDDIPDALRSVDRQRADLVKLLQALDRLSGVGVRVIKASKESTINTLRDLGPVLEGFAKAGQNFPKSFQVFLTYPFVDAAVGRDPQVARNLHMGDYTNLSVNLDLNVANLPKLPTGPVCEALGEVLDTTRANVGKAADALVDAVPDNPLITKAERKKLRDALVDKLLKNALAEARKQCEAPDVASLTKTGNKFVTDLLDVLNILTPTQIRQLLNGTLGQLGGALDGLSGATAGGGGGGGVGSGLGLPRVEPGGAYRLPEPVDPFDLARHGFDPGIGTMLLQGVADVR
jgi:virulence factor Mce-like protein